MNKPAVVHLENAHTVLEPLQTSHAPALEAAAADGELWKLGFTSVPAPGQATSYIAAALRGQAEGHMLPFAVRERRSGQIVGTTRYYEIDPALPRLAIGYTWYARCWQKTHLNTACKHLLLRHAFDTMGCVAVAFHTDIHNLDSQRAIERLGARREGVWRAHKRRTDGSLRDTVCFSITAGEWPDVARSLDLRMRRAGVDGRD